LGEGGRITNLSLLHCWFNNSKANNSLWVVRRSERSLNPEGIESLSPAVGSRASLSLRKPTLGNPYGRGMALVERPENVEGSFFLATGWGLTATLFVVSTLAFTAWLLGDDDALIVGVITGGGVGSL
jgi:hypothetical protein